jgi:NAD(P)-dependent dehydrogenase (short-subunit alcohol dehydrogenase family)
VTDLAGRTVVVTGAANGLGAAYARELGSLGAATVLVDRDPRVEEVAGSLPDAVAVVGDVTDAAVADRAVAAADEATGRIDGLVCNAGIGAAAGPVHRHDDAALDLVLRTHLHHTAIWTRAAWPHLRAAVGGGAIVTTSSATALGLAGAWDYAAAKGAIWSLTRSVAMDGARHGVRVNAVMPMAYTPMAATYPDERVREWMRAAFDPAEVAPVVAWLLHPDCPTSGECFSVGAGRVARVVMAVAPGLESETPLTLDSVAAGWDRAMSTEGLVVAESSMSDSQMMRRALSSYPTDWPKPAAQRASCAVRRGAPAASDHRGSS